jgi:hypothetical protein
VRTVKVRLTKIVDRELRMEYETEAIVDDEAGWDSGHAAGRILSEFQRGVVAGYLEAAEEGEAS